MNTIKVTASELKNNLAEVLNKVAFGNTRVEVERHGKVIAEIVPPKDSGVVETKKRMAELFGALPDFPDVTKDRYTRKKDLTL
jgi:prevent-host-death family protein